MIRLVATFWLFSAVAVFGNPFRGDQEEQDIQRSLEDMLTIKSFGYEPLESNEIPNEELVKPEPEEEFPIEEPRDISELELKLRPFNNSFKETPVKNSTKDVTKEIPTEKFEKPGHQVEFEPLKKSVLKNLKNFFVQLELKVKDPSFRLHEGFDKSRRIPPRNWRPIINTVPHVTTEHPDSPLPREEDPIIYYLLRDTNHLGCKYVPDEPRIVLDEDFMEELFHPTLHPLTKAMNNLRNLQRKFAYFSSQQDVPRKSANIFDFECPEGTSSSNFDGECTVYITCLDGKLHLNSCPPKFCFNPRVVEGDMDSCVLSD